MQDALRRFAISAQFRGKGPLSVALVITDQAKLLGLPLDPDALLTQGGGQVLELGKARVQSILARNGETRVLSEEAGRTSRGSIAKMRAYVAFLNQMHQLSSPLDLALVEAFWVEQVRDFFRGKPFALAFDESSSLRSVVAKLLDQALKRQKESPGTTFMGTMMQHLVGAKLEVLLGPGVATHESASASDESTQRSGDFEVGDVAIHVTANPGEALMRKCRSNLERGLKPLIVTTRRGAALADLNAEQFGLGAQLDVFEIEQWLASNVMEWSEFGARSRRLQVSELVMAYNKIVDKVESDPSLRIEPSSGRG
ncbi:MAG: DUF4928 family protein [Bosea sp.]|nr:DUF4928 family protein [Bosea sp. (in: a-proteobacteria)]